MSTVELDRRMRAYYGRLPKPAEAPPAETAKELEHVSQRAFLTVVDGKAVVTAPAKTWGFEKASTPNSKMLWVHGAFVGAEKANRNGALWTTKDLEVGEPTVRYGPLNWLHEERHIIGAIADSKLVTPETEAASVFGGITDPYIAAAATVWKWIWPDESRVVEMASEAGQLWFSMECFAEQIECAGEGSCGESFDYVQVVRAQAGCEHIRERSASRRMVDPTFLGGAVIVPPVRPGWGEARAEVMAEAASLAEDAYEQAGEPDMPAAAWEQLMAHVVEFARG